MPMLTSRISPALLVYSLTILAGCAATTSLDQMVLSGGHLISDETIQAKFSGKNLQLQATNFEAMVLLKDNNKIAARNAQKETDTGSWRIVPGDQLCLEFDTWFFGDEECYAIGQAKEENTYFFFADNGAKYYTAAILDFIPASLVTLGIGKNNTSIYDRQSPLAPQPVQPTLTALSEPSLESDEEQLFSSEGDEESVLTDEIESLSSQEPATELPSSDEEHQADPLVAEEISDQPLSDTPPQEPEEIPETEPDLAAAPLISEEPPEDEPQEVQYTHGIRSDEMKRIMLVAARDCPGCNFTGLDLSRSSLVGANLAGAKLTGTDLSATNLSQANLTGADLSGANLQGATLNEANLRGANLSGADLSGASLIKADLHGTLRKGTILTNALIKGKTQQ